MSDGRRGVTPGTRAQWRAKRQSGIRHALDVARGNQRYDLPFRRVVRIVDVLMEPVARGPQLTVTRLELECGHLVAPPGGALVERTRTGAVRQCRECMSPPAG